MLRTLPPGVAAGTKVGAAGARRPLRIAIWTGPAWESWNPGSLKTGIGGSETAAICMGRELAKLGNSVQVFGNCKDREGSWDGVEYLHWERPWAARERIDDDVLLVSRQTSPLSHFTKVKAKILWMHDVHVGESAKVKGEIANADRVLALSNWHRDLLVSTYPEYPSERVMVTRNGIDVSRFENEVPKVGNRLIYASSPERGLERLLNLFPLIRAAVPDAELHVYHGFKTWMAMAKNRNAEAEVLRIEALKKMIQETPRVVYYDRVGQDELAKAFLEAKVWTYPTWFTETFCITAIEAQAAGCIPVTSALAALNETVHHGFLLTGSETTAAYGAAFVARVVDLLTDDETRRAHARAARKRAMRTWGWDQLAVKWETMFGELLEEKHRELVPGTVSMPVPGTVKEVAAKDIDLR